MVTICKQCGAKLFEQDGSNRKIFRSFATRKENGFEYYLCIDCHEGKNKEMFGNATRANKSVSDEET